MQTAKSNIDKGSRVYLLKPTPVIALRATHKKAGTEKSLLRPIQLQNVPEAYTDSGNTGTRFLIHTRDEIKVILFDEVVCCVADSNYTHVHLSDGSKVMVSKTLKEIETILSPGFFVRIHASNLINLHFIKRILKTHQYKVELTNQIVLDVSRSRRDGLMQKMEML